MSSHNRVQYVKQDQPAFLKKFKERVGLKHEATVSDKLQAEPDDCVDEEKDDEKPVVVVLNEGDLTAEEVAAHDKKMDDGKITFKKPTKRNLAGGLSATTKKVKTNEGNHSSYSYKSTTKDKQSSARDKRKKKAAVTPSSLLSFDECEDE